MNNSISYSDARARFAEIWDKVIDDREIMLLSRRGKDDVAMIAADELNSILETMHLLKSKKNAESLFSALDAANSGKGQTMSLDELKKEVLGI